MNNNHFTKAVFEFQKVAFQVLLNLSLLNAGLSSANEHNNQMYFK